MSGYQAGIALAQVSNSSIIHLLISGTRLQNKGMLTNLVCRLKSFSDLEKFKDLDLYQNVIAKDLKAGGELIEKVEVHHSTAFDGYLNKKVIEDDLSSGTSK